MGITESVPALFCQTMSYMNIHAVLADFSRLFPALAPTLPLGRVFRCYVEDMCMCNAAEGT